MKKAFKSAVALLFCLMLITSTVTVSLAVGKVTGAKATNVTYNSATLTWKKVKGADGYQVRSYVNKKYSKTVDVKKKTEYKFKLTPGKSYSLQVRAYDKKVTLKGTKYEYSSWIKVSVKAVPTQVKSLKGTQSGNSVKLTWSKVSDVTGYNVQQYVKKKWKTIATVTKNSYTVKKQKYQTTQKFRVSAYKTYKKKNYTGDYSSTVSVTLATPAPAKVSSLKATQSGNSVKLSWKKIDGVKGYTVQQYKSKKWTTIKTVTTNSYTVTKQKYQSTQQFRVRAYKMYDDIKVYGSYSSTAKVTLATPAPAQVTSLKGTQSAKSVKLTWSAISGVNGYTVQQYKSKKWTTIKTVTTNSYTVTNQAYQSTPQFRVCAYKMYDDIKVSGAYSSTVSVKIATPAPAAVTSFKATQSGNSVKLSWAAVSGANGYTVQQYVSSAWKTIKTATTNSHTVSSLTYGSTYKFRVCAYKMYDDIKVSGAYTSEASVTIKTAVPSSFKLSSVATTSAKLTWSAVTGATGYEVYDYATQKTVTVKTNSYSPSSLSAGTSYKFKVRSYAGSYKSAWTSDVSFITVPEKLSGLTAPDVTTSTITLSWTKLTGCTAYQVQKYDGVNWVSACSDTASTKASFASLKTNELYKYRVRGYLKDGSTTRYGAWSDELSVKTKLPAPELKTTPENNTTNQLHLSWNAIDSAEQYVLEYYNAATYSWYTAATVTETTYIDSTTSGKAKLYRVSALSEDGTKGMPSKGITVAPSSLSITQDNFSATVNWGDIENTSSITSYEIYMKPLYNNNFSTQWKLIETKAASDLDSYTVYLTPGAINAYMIKIQPANKAIVYFEFDADELVIDNSDSSKNAQLLYLVNAINKTKTEQTSVTATKKITTMMNMYYLRLKGSGPAGLLLEAMASAMGGDYNLLKSEVVFSTPESINSFMNYMDEKDSSSADVLNTPEVSNESYVFTEGKAKNSKNTTVYLQRFIEPSGEYQTKTNTSTGKPYYILISESTLASLPNQNNPTAWKNGFSAVNTVKNADGTYTLTATLKAESYGEGTGNTKPLYHSAFTSSLDSLTKEGSIDGGEIKSKLKVGTTTITAKIAADGRLISYSTALLIDMDVTTLLTKEAMGNMGECEMQLKTKGDETIEYTFVR